MLLATAVTLNCATNPEAPGLEMRPATPDEFDAPQRAVQSAPEMTVNQPVADPQAASPAQSGTETGDSADMQAVASEPAAPAAVAPMSEPEDPIEARIDELLATMTIEQKVGQRFMTWIPGTGNSERAAALIEQAHVGA